MILLEAGNRILGETVGSQVIREDDGKREPMDVRLSDFDDVSYHVVLDANDRETLKVSVGLPFWGNIKDFGGQQALDKYYPGLYTSSPEAGYDVTLDIKFSAIQGKPEDFVQNISRLKDHIVGGVFDFFFQNLLKATPQKPWSFNQRSDTTVYFIPGADRVTVIYGISFQDRVDKAVGRIMLQEFAESRRGAAMGAAPPVNYNPNPPMELKEFGITEVQPNVLGYLSFAVLKSHIDKPEKSAKVCSALQSFRSFLQYHLKCSKAYFHSRMRARCGGLLAVLNRAKVEAVGAEKKTASGKTFTRT